MNYLEHSRYLEGLAMQNSLARRIIKYGTSQWLLRGVSHDKWKAIMYFLSYGASIPKVMKRKWQ